jgi:hypothetical protein
MKTHIQIVAALHIALGALSVIGAIVLFACLGLAGTIVVSQGEQAVAGILGIIAVVLCGFLVLLGLPGIIGGWALITERSWGRPLVLVLGIPQSLQHSHRHRGGVYTLWALLNRNPLGCGSGLLSSSSGNLRHLRDGTRAAGGTALVMSSLSRTM